MLDIRRQLEILLEANQKINSILDVPVIMRTLVESAMELIDASSGTAGIFVDNKMVFTEYNEKSELIPINYTFEKGYGVPGWIIENKKPYITNDAQNDKCVIPEIQETLAFYNLIDVPILNKSGDLMGCFELHNSVDRRDFNEIDVELLMGLSASAAIALENTELIMQHKQDKDSLIKRDEELSKRVRELEDFYNMSVNRELKMKQLKHEIQELKKKLSNYEN